MFLQLQFSYDPVPYVALVGDELHLVTHSSCALRVGALSPVHGLSAWLGISCLPLPVVLKHT